MAENHPYPNLQIHANSGLSIAWAEDTPKAMSTSDASMGDSGVALGMVIWIYWDDIQTALTEILGYSYRDATIPSAPRLRRLLPWQHPFLNQIYAKNISKVEPVRLLGTDEDSPEDDLHIRPREGSPGQNTPPGPGSGINLGPWSTWYLAKLTIHFWRPPYFVRPDSGILDDNDNPMEWMRYVDKQWKVNVQLLTREGSTFVFAPGQGLPAGKAFQGSVGQKMTHLKISRTWHQIPEQCLFAAGQDITPSGIPTNLLFTQTPTTSPIASVPDPTMNLSDIPTYPGRNLPSFIGSPIQGCVNAPIMNDPTKTAGWVKIDGIWTYDIDPTKMFLGFPAGTLLLEGIEITPRDLQLPAYLMEIPAIAQMAISQQQYDITFNFEYFDPPKVPYAGCVIYVQITNQGAGYTAPPTVQFGTGADAPTGVSVLNSDKVAYVLVTNAGQNLENGVQTIPSNVPNIGGRGLQGIQLMFSPVNGEDITNAASGWAVVSSSIPPARFRGHNLMPFSGNGYWYAVVSQQGPINTPLSYADFSDLFRVL